MLHVLTMMLGMNVKPTHTVPLGHVIIKSHQSNGGGQRKRKSWIFTFLPTPVFPLKGRIHVLF